MDKTFSKKLVIIGFIFALLLIVGCEKKEWPTNPHDLTRPEVVASNPEDASIMNSIDQPISITFTQEMSLSSISELVKVTDGHENVIPGTWDGSGGTYFFTPQNGLSNLTLYTVNMKGAFTLEGEWLGPGVRDANGNSLENETTISFSTLGNYGHTPLYLGTGGDNGGVFAIVQNLELSEFEGYPGEGIQTPAINPAGTKVYVASSDNSKVFVIDVPSNSVSTEISMPDGVEGPRTLAVTPNGNEVWVACNGTMDIAVINAASNQVEATISLADYAEDMHSMTINHAGTRGYITTNWDQGVIVVDIQNRAVLEYIEGVATVESSTDIIVSPDDSKIIVFLAWAEEEVAVIDAATNEISYMSLGSGGDGWMVDVEGNYLYACNRFNGNIYKINMTSMSVEAETNIESEMKGIAVDTDKEVVYAIAPTYNDEGAIFILTSSDLSQLGTIPAGNYRYIVTP
ncbi:MAG: Ig-like domain-containing protein [Melioribacteraceae bacterium]